MRIMQEYRAVLRRPKFGFNLKEVDTMLDFMIDQGEFVIAAPGTKNLPDQYDIPFLEVALTGRADALITGNLKHFPQKVCKPIKIYSPADNFQQI
jgi:predicted nucleic acid-binding protein